MNLLEFKNTLDLFTQFTVEFLVTDSMARCYWCNKPSTDSANYRNMTVVPANTSDEKLASIDFKHIIEVDYDVFIAVTTDNHFTYHCPACKNGPIAISKEDTDKFIGYAREALRAVSKELGIKPKVKIYNKRNAENGYFTEKNPDTIHINLALVELYHDVRSKVWDVVAHETRHAWQHRNKPEIYDGYVSSHVDYEKYYNHPAEVDARDYATEFVNRFLTASV
jgi:hypothetical protein